MFTCYLQLTRRTALFAGDVIAGEATIEALPVLLPALRKRSGHEKNAFCGHSPGYILCKLKQFSLKKKIIIIAMIREFCDDVIAHVHIAMTMKIRLIVQPYSL